MTPPAVLLVDDEIAIQRAIAGLLRSRGYAAFGAASGREALELFERVRPVLVVLDLGLPDMSGIDVCRQLRGRADVPILVLSVRGDEHTKVAALDAGADDYVTKPFSAEELLARVRAALRRSGAEAQSLHGRVTWGDLSIDFDRRRVCRDADEIRLTPKEFDLLTLLAANAGRVLTHRAILNAVWGAHSSVQPEHLRVLVGQLRRKIERDPARPRYVVTEPWVGYRFAAEPPT